MLKAIGYLFVAAGFLYFLFYPWLKHSVNRKKFFRWFIILYCMAMLASAIKSYMAWRDQPASSTEGVENKSKSNTNR